MSDPTKCPECGQPIQFDSLVTDKHGNVTYPPPIENCEHLNVIDGCCGHPDAVTPECHPWADCPPLQEQIKRLTIERDTARASHNFHMYACAKAEVERNIARQEVERLAAELEGYADYKTRTAEAEANRLQAEARAAEALTEKHAALQRAQEYIESANRAHDERDAIRAELADSRTRMADVIAAALIENAKLRRILSHVPGKVALKAKEDAGHGESIVLHEQPPVVATEGAGR